MKSLELEMLNCSELNVSEMVAIEGGNFLHAIGEGIGFIIGALAHLFVDKKIE